MRVSLSRSRGDTVFRTNYGHGSGDKCLRIDRVAASGSDKRAMMNYSRGGAIGVCWIGSVAWIPLAQAVAKCL